MQKDKMNTQIRDIIDDVIRGCKIGQSAEILEMLPELLESVVVDKRYILKCYEKELKKKSGNPFKAFFSLMGLRLVNPNDVVRELGDEIKVENDYAAGETADSFLKLDSKKLKKSVENITDKLSVYEKNSISEFNINASKQKEAINELNRVSQNYNQLNAEYNNMIDAVVQRAQYILSVTGEGNISNNSLTEQIVELLRDFDMEIYWNSTEATLSHSQLFTVYKTNDPSTRKVKPAIVKNDKVLAKGIKYIALEEE